MREPIIQEASLPPRPSLGFQPRIASLAAAVRSLGPNMPPKNQPPAPRARWRWGLLIGVALGVGAATVLNAPEPEPWVVSGSPRLKQTETGDFVRWHSAEVTLTIDPSLHKLGKGADDSVLLAFDAWHAGHPGLPRLTYDVSSRPRKVERDGVNLITFEKIEIPGHEHALAVTIGYSDARTGKIIEVDMIVNARHEFALLDQSEANGAEHPDSSGQGHSKHPHGADEGCRQAYDLQAVLAHEAGHFFGLGEDKDEAEATMYFKTGRCDIKQRDLAKSDVAAVQTVYSGPLLEADEGAATAQACALSRQRPVGTSWLGLILALGVTTGRLRRLLRPRPSPIAKQRAAASAPEPVS